MPKSVNQKDSLELALKYEAKAKEIRQKIQKEKDDERQRLSNKLLKILEEVVGRELGETDLDKFRGYAFGIGKVYIIKAVDSNVTAPN